MSDETRTGEAIALARQLFLRDDNRYGCAEAAVVALQRTYALPDAQDSSAAMVLNGGIAYSGNMCGAISGAALAVGKLAAARIEDHSEAKRTARKIMQRVMAEFDTEFGSHNCSGLIEYDLSTESGHDAFIESGVWRDTCARQIEFSVGRLAGLADIGVWNETVASLVGSSSENGNEH